MGRGRQVSGQWYRWAKQWNWKARAAAWDAHLDQQHLAGAEEMARAAGADWQKRQEEHRERIWLKANAILDKLDTILAMDVDQGKLTPWTLQAVVTTFGQVDRIARLACGLTPDRKAAGPQGGGPVEQRVELFRPRHDLEIKDPDQMTDDELRACAATVLADRVLAQLLGSCPGSAPPEVDLY